MGMYALAFKPTALKEWRKLDAPIREQFKRKLPERLAQPHVPASRLHAMPDCYKIKLQATGYRLVYQVTELTITVTVVAVGKREDAAVTRKAQERL